MGYKVAVVGATGNVGREMLNILDERKFPADEVVVLASRRSVGVEVSYGDRTLKVKALEHYDFSDVDICLMSAGGSVSKEWSPKIGAAGAVVIDNSSAWRMDPDVPLVVPEVNGARAPDNEGIVANPNCCTIPLTCVLKPLHGAAGLRRVRVATYQSMSGAGAMNMQRLADTQPHELDLLMEWDFDGEEFDEETKLREETRKIMELPELPISANCVRVPVMVGHAETVWVETESPLSADDARHLLGAAAGVKLEDFPSPGKATGIDEVLVGRIRQDPTDSKGLVLFLACDNLRKGAALNAIQIAELLVGREALAA
jgi:aspartate-semialdehyde dehydrogenase